MGVVITASDVSSTWQSMLRTIRRLAGMPDYAAYLEHLRQRHPGQPVPTEREYYDEFIARKYAGGGGRCC